MFHDRLLPELPQHELIPREVRAQLNKLSDPTVLEQVIRSFVGRDPDALSPEDLKLLVSSFGELDRLIKALNKISPKDGRKLRLSDFKPRFLQNSADGHSMLAFFGKDGDTVLSDLVISGSAEARRALCDEGMAAACVISAPLGSLERYGLRTIDMNDKIVMPTLSDIQDFARSMGVTSRNERENALVWASAFEHENTHRLGFAEYTAYSRQYDFLVKHKLLKHKPTDDKITEESLLRNFNGRSFMQGLLERYGEEPRAEVLDWLEGKRSESLLSQITSLVMASEQERRAFIEAAGIAGDTPQEQLGELIAEKVRLFIARGIRTGVEDYFEQRGEADYHERALDYLKGLLSLKEKE